MYNINNWEHYLHRNTLTEYKVLEQQQDGKFHRFGFGYPFIAYPFKEWMESKSLFTLIKKPKDDKMMLKTLSCFEDKISDVVLLL